MGAAARAHAEEVEKAKEQHRNEVAELSSEHIAAIEAARGEHEAAMGMLKAEHEEAVAAAGEELERTKAEHGAALAVPLRSGSTQWKMRRGRELGESVTSLVMFSTAVKTSSMRWRTNPILQTRFSDRVTERKALAHRFFGAESFFSSFFLSPCATHQHWCLSLGQVRLQGRVWGKVVGCNKRVQTRQFCSLQASREGDPPLFCGGFGIERNSTPNTHGARKGSAARLFFAENGEIAAIAPNTQGCMGHEGL